MGQTAGLPKWARDLVESYESNAASQFIVSGNVNDRMVVSASSGKRIGSLTDFLLDVLLPRFGVVLSYDLGNGIRVEKGGETLAKWPNFMESQKTWKEPRPAVETLTRFFRYCGNLASLGRESIQVACIVNSADLLAPTAGSAASHDLGAVALLLRDWANDSLLAGHALATFLVTENLADLHPMIVNNPRAFHVRIALPSPADLAEAFTILGPSCPTAFEKYAGNPDGVAQQLAGTTLGAVESMLKTKQHRKEPIVSDDLVRLKKQLVEKDCSRLIEFIESTRTLDDLYGMEAAKAWLRQDVALWRSNDVAALPKGYLICGPVGTGKTFLVECLAGEAGVPIVKMKNFRDKWVGSSEGNLEKIFRLLRALGRCYVFVDEADQALGRRESGTGDSGLSGRIYSMIAEEMGDSTSRGRVVWILASSRPDLIEVDLKRPGRIDVKIPLFPTVTAREGFELIRMLCRKRGLEIDDSRFSQLEASIPSLLTPGAAETLAMKIYRSTRTEAREPFDALARHLAAYQSPVPKDVMRFQIQLAVNETSDADFVPPFFRAAATDPSWPDNSRA